MKYTICGKGGSGKSTVTTMLAREFARQGKRVLVLDCDESNFGLSQQLGMELPSFFVDQLGGRGEVSKLMSNGPGELPQVFRNRWTIADIPADHVSEKDGILLMTPGKIRNPNEGCACSFNIALALFLMNLDLAVDDIVLMDMEAGIEHFGRGSDNSADGIIMVVDPSYESVKLAHKIREIASQLGKPVYFVLNKVTPENESILRKAADKPTDICAILAQDERLAQAGLLGIPLTVSQPAICQMAAYLEQRSRQTSG